MVIDRLLIHLLLPQKHIQQILLILLRQVEAVSELFKLLFGEIGLLLVFQVDKFESFEDGL